LDTVVALDKSVVSAAAAVYQEQVLLVTSTLTSLLMKAGLSLNVFWQGTSKFTTCTELTLFHDPRHSGLYSAFVWLKLFPGNSVFLDTK